ncbi:hypothetical protein K488DRAFT_89821 [Vararia minispora EC-137]|uniref:Uncharacterized protein n=1 Tax=Vararia minispora EC-137 TaxID=1314806 RepID=A0ACB8Q9S3_9AGAM|nr:hypothetical protein K488DRAFT_89821 [Vararia minispora EC-137]
MTNLLGLDIETPETTPHLHLEQTQSSQTSDKDATATGPSDDDAALPRSDAEKPKPKSTPAAKAPYVNPDRVKTGGPTRDKPTDAELSERMARIREQNERIKQRRLDVQADEDAFRQTQQAEHVKQEKMRKVQQDVDRAREQNARRKLDKIQNREWDSGKKTNEWPKASLPSTSLRSSRPEPSTVQSDASPPTSASNHFALGVAVEVEEGE